MTPERELASTRLWIVSKGAVSVRDDAAAPAIAQAPMWGLGKVFAHEFPDQWGGLLDLSPESATKDLKSVLGEITSSDGVSDCWERTQVIA